MKHVQIHLSYTISACSVLYSRRHVVIVQTITKLVFPWARNVVYIIVVYNGSFSSDIACLRAISQYMALALA